MFGKNRVEQDLARIREANLPQEKLPEPKNTASDERFGATDILAMIIAVFSLLLPYLAVFVGVIGLVVWLIGRVW